MNFLSTFLTANNSEPAKEVNNSVFNVVAAPEVNTNLFEKTTRKLLIVLIKEMATSADRDHY